MPLSLLQRQTWKWIQRQANALWSKHQTLAEMRRTGGGAGSANCACVCTRITSTAIPALNYNAPAVIQSEELLTWSCGTLQCRETHGGKGGVPEEHVDKRGHVGDPIVTMWRRLRRCFVTEEHQSSESLDRTDPRPPAASLGL
ncbi:hypothetical protein FKM82_022564 [Ascaphus truei]